MLKDEFIIETKYGTRYTIKKYGKDFEMSWISGGVHHMETRSREKVERWIKDGSWTIIEEEDEMKEFTKDDLVAGKHVVEFRNGTKAIYLVNGFFESNGECVCHESYVDLDLKGSFGDIVKVYSINRSDSSHTLGFICGNSKLIWERQEKSKEEIELEELEKQQREIADKMAEIRERIRK